MDARVAEHRRGGAVTSLIFPTYNPGPLLEQTWEALGEFLHQAPSPWEVLFVCDGCTDGTPQRLAELVAGQPAAIRIIDYARNRGKGYAVRQGLSAARGDWRIFADVDLAYGFDDIERLAQVLQKGADVAIASRSHRDSRILLPTALQGYLYRRHLQSLAFSVLTRCLLPLSLRDTQAGLKGLSARAVRQILPELTCDGFGFDCELLTACVYHGLAIAEVPVCVRYADHSSTTSARAMARMLGDIWRIRTAWRNRPAQPSTTLEALPERQAA
jgi:dolichyl-phosphate beta-glucosyltransferase